MKVNILNETVFTDVSSKVLVKVSMRETVTEAQQSGVN